MSALFVYWGFVGSPAWGVGGADTGTAPADTDTLASGDSGSSETGGWDSGASTCPECVGAAEDVGEEGGAACEGGCSTGGRASMGAWVLGCLVAVRRRR